MNILIHLSNHLMSEAFSDLLARSGHESAVVNGDSANGFVPDIVLVDSTTLTQGFLARYPEKKVLLLDDGLGPGKLYATLLSHRIHGVLSPDTDLHLLTKALKVVREGQLWIDNESVKAVLDDAGDFSRKGKINRITAREQEIVECICQGLSNKEIAHRLDLSPHTVKSHLTRIFTKFHVRSRSKLMTLATLRP